MTPQIQMVKQGLPEARCHLGVILGDAADDLSEIVQGSLREEELAVHWGKRLRTSVAGTVRPGVASSRPSSMAARVSSSSSSKTGLGLSMSNFFALAMAHDSPGPLTSRLLVRNLLPCRSLRRKQIWLLGHDDPSDYVS